MSTYIGSKHAIEFEGESISQTRLALDDTGFGMPSICSTDEESSDGSVFETLGDESSGIDHQLCAYCQFICDNWSRGRNDTNFVYPHVGDIFLLEEAVATGCTMCAQFMQSASSDEVRKAKEETEQHCSAGFQNGGFEDEFARNIINLSVELVPTNFSGSIRDLDDDPTYSTKYSLPLASQWLKICRKAHWQCNFSRGQTTPHRLVTTDKNCTRLRLREDFQDPPEYATLSHCWGEKRFVTLERHNLDNFKEMIPQEALPQTFMDAILIARELGIQYIWIDSLCIIQDDTDDWLQEAATMSSVYGGSTLNIAASGAHDGAIGCFLRPQHTSRCQIRVESGGRTLHYRCVPGKFYSHALSEMPLMKRGWTLQERLLPSRTLHFTSTQVFWECYQKVACETFPDEFPLWLTYSSCYLQKQPVSISMWSWIVERYSRCNLTRTEDKLVAISGLAREIQSQTRDQYVAGMWRKDLEFQLCWHNWTGQICQRITPYRAPTWSWASLNCLINISGMKSFRDTAANTGLWIKVLNIRLRFAGPDTLGQISAANLRLGCRSLLHVTLETDYDDYIIMAKEKVNVIISPDEGNTAKMRKAVVLPVLGSSRQGYISGLLIEPTKQEKGQYRRLGFFNIFRSDDCAVFEAASTERSNWVESTDLVKIRKDKFGNTYSIINMI